MTDKHNIPSSAKTGGAASDSAMERALDEATNWVILMERPTRKQAREFEKWLNASPLHADAYRKMKYIWDSAYVVLSARSLSVPPKVGILSRLGSHWRSLATAAVLILGLFNFTDLPLRLQADHLTQAGERQRLQLADGSRILLNTRSAFSSTIDDQRRIARLYQGEAFFEIPASHEQLLELEIGPVRASVRDTAFVVRYLDSVAQVGVQRGDVDLQAPHTGTRVRLSAGESIRVGPNGFDRPARLDPDRDLAWVRGRLVFENCPLGEVLAELRRYYPGWILNNNERLAEVAVTGNYRLDQPLDVVRSLAQITSARLQEFPALVILN